MHSNQRESSCALDVCVICGNTFRLVDRNVAFDLQEFLSCSPIDLLKTPSSNIGGRHLLGTKRVIGSESSPNDDVALVSNTRSECAPKGWRTWLIGAAATR